MRKFVCLWIAALATTLMSAPQPVSAQMSDVRPPVSDMPTPTSRPAPVMRPGQSGATLFSVQQQRRQQIREDKGCDEKLKLVNDLEQRLRKIRERCEKLEVRQRKREEDLRKTEQEVEEERQRRADLRAEQQRKGDAYRAALAEREQAKARLDAAKDALKRAQEAAIDYFVERTDTEREDWHLSPPEGEEDSFVALEVKPGLTVYLDNSDGLWTPTRIRNGEFWLRDEFRESDQGRDIRDAIEDAKKELEEAQKAFDEAEAAEGEAGDAFYEADQAVHGLPPLTQPLTRAEERLQEAVDTLRDCREEEVATANRLAEARSELEECEKEAAAEAELERVQREAEEQIEELEDQIKEAEEDLKEAEEELSQPLPEDASEEAKEEREEAQRDAEEARRAIEEAKAAIDAAKNAIGLGPMDPGLDSPAAVRKAAREAEKKLVQATGKSQTGSTKASGAKQRIKDVRASEAERRRLRAQRLARANRGIGRVKNALIDLSDQTKARAGGGLFGIGENRKLAKAGDYIGMLGDLLQAADTIANMDCNMVSALEAFDALLSAALNSQVGDAEGAAIGSNWIIAMAQLFGSDEMAGIFRNAGRQVFEEVRKRVEENEEAIRELRSSLRDVIQGMKPCGNYLPEIDRLSD